MLNRQDAKDNKINASTTSLVDARLQGGPHDGQCVRVPDDQPEHVAYHHGQPHRYLRTNRALIFRHTPSLSRMFGGRK